MTGKRKAVHDLIEAFEEYLLEFIRVARAASARPALAPHRARLFAALDAVIDEAEREEP